MKQSTIFLFCFGIDDVLSGSSKVAGIQVQMSFWAKTFVKNGWKVFSFSDKKERVIDGIHFIQNKTSWLKKHGMSIVEEPFKALHFLQKTKPDIVFVRGGRRDLYAIKKACNICNSKLVFLGASDRDFEPGKELILGSNINVKLYRKGLQENNYFITQNKFQAENLFKHYGKESIIIPNIWAKSNLNNGDGKKYAAIWIANLRRLKRAEWFVQMASKLPQYRFAIVGGVNEQDYYDYIKTECEHLDNLDFLGAQALEKVNALLSESQILVCTSEFEGFPNTFLQAWAQNIPVISTVDPSNLITKYELGKIIQSESELVSSITELLVDIEKQEKIQHNIESYFISNHDADMAYKIMIKQIIENESNNAF